MGSNGAPNPQIDIKTAVRRAMEFVRDVYEGVELKDLALEEIRLSEDDQWWLVTVGFGALGGYTELQGRSATLFPLAGRSDVVRLPRDLKLVKIDARTGQPAPVLTDRELSQAG